MVGLNDTVTPVGAPAAESDTDCAGPDTVRVEDMEAPMPPAPEVDDAVKLTDEELKVAETVEGVVTVIDVGLVVPERAPPHPVKVFPANGLACCETAVPAGTKTVCDVPAETDPLTMAHV